METDPTVSDLLEQYLAPEKLCGENQYHCVRCAGLREAERQVRLLTLPQLLVVSLVRFVFDRQTGARRKVLAAVDMTERLVVPLADRPPAQYQLYAVIVHAGHSLDSGHYFSFCRVSGGCSDDVGGDWWRFDDTSATPVTTDDALGRLRRSTETPYTLLYRLEGAEAARARPSALAELPGPLRTAVGRDNAAYRLHQGYRRVGPHPPLSDALCGAARQRPRGGGGDEGGAEAKEDGHRSASAAPA